MPYRQITGVGANGRVVIDDPDPSLLAAHAALTVSAHGIGGEWFQTYLQRGVVRSGITAGQAGYFFDEFVDLSRWYEAFGLVPVTAMTTMTGGVINFAVAAGDNSEYHNGTAGFGSPTLVGANANFYLATRFSMDAANWDGQSSVGLTDAITNLVEITHAPFGNYLLAIVNMPNPWEFVASTIPVDALAHDFEAWCHAGIYYFSVDNETPVVLTPAHAPTGLVHPMMNGIGGAADPQVFYPDKYLLVFPQAA